MPLTAQERASAVARWTVPLAVGVVCVAAGKAWGLVSPLLMGLVLGIVWVNISRHSRTGTHDQAAYAKLMLRWGVVLLGLRLPLDDVVGLGIQGLVIIVVTVTLTFTLTCAVGDRLGLDRSLVTLVASGFAVCGAAAIAAVETGIRRRDEDAALAVVLVTIFGTAMIVVVPTVAGWLGFSERQTGAWAGASIHEVAQVVAASATAGAAAVAIATTIKLGRVATLAVVFVLARRRHSGDTMEATTNRVPRVPWFVVGFMLAATLRSSGEVPAGMLSAFELVTTVLLAAGMFGLGLGIRVSDLFPLPWRVLSLALISTVVAATSSGVMVGVFI